MQYGGSNKSLISNLPGKNLYKPVNYSVPVDKLIKDNFGIGYTTSAGGSKMNSHKVKLMLKKTTKKIMKGGEEHQMMHSEESSLSGGKKKKTTKKKMKGGEEHQMMHSEESSMSGGKKKKTTKKTTKKKMKGGEESWGATGMPIQFYDPKAPLANYPFNSGLNAKSAYGPVDPKDVGVGMLAPMNTSKNTPIPVSFLISQTGGKKKPKTFKNKKGGNGSDFVSTLNSRGPSNAPDMYWGIDGEKWFRQFNKTANYIPNSQLAKAATPKLLEGPKNDAVIGYNAFSDAFAPIKGGKSKSKVKSKAKSKVKSKAMSKVKSKPKLKAKSKSKTKVKA